jgi:sec-independent protein translocase protein TatA
MGLDNPLHIAFIVVILLLLFGAKRLPEIGRSLGSGMREFKQAVTGDGGASQSVAQPAITQAAQQPPQAPVAQPVAAQPAAAPAAAPASTQAPAEPTPQA